MWFWCLEKNKLKLFNIYFYSDIMENLGIFISNPYIYRDIILIFICRKKKKEQTTTFASVKRFRYQIKCTK